MSAKALSDIRVLDLTRVRAGPAAVRQLADWGAQVIKIEIPEDKGTDGPRHGSDFQNLHRNKRSMTLDVKSAESRRIFFQLVNRADVVVETTGQMSSDGSASAMKTYVASTSESSMRAFPAMARMVPTSHVPDSIKSRREWVALWRSLECRDRDRYAPALRSRI